MRDSSLQLIKVRISPDWPRIEDVVEIGSDDENHREMFEIGKCSGKGGWREADQVVVKEDLQLLQL